MNGSEIHNSTKCNSSLTRTYTNFSADIYTRTSQFSLAVLYKSQEHVTATQRNKSSRQSLLKIRAITNYSPDSDFSVCMSTTTHTQQGYRAACRGLT